MVMHHPHGGMAEDETMALPRPSLRFTLFVLAVAVGNAVAHMCTSAMPLQVGALIDGFHLSATAAGIFGFCQVGSLAVSMILFSPLVHRFRPLWVCLAGIAVAVVSNLLVFNAPPVLPLLCLLGVVSGLGYSLMLTATVAAPAGWPMPDRVYAASSSGGLLILVALLSVLPFANSYFGVRGIFVGIAVLLAACVPLLWGFRYTAAVADGAPVTQSAFTGGRPLLVIWALFSFGTGALWTFAERIGHALQLSGPTIGLIISTSVFLALVGSGLAALLSTRLDRRAALAIGMIGSGGACLLMTLATGFWGYAIAAGLYWILTIFTYIMMLGTAATIDPTGRLATLGTGCERLAYACGAPVGGFLVDHASFLVLGIVAFTSCAVVGPLCLPALGRMLHRIRNEPLVADPAFPLV